ncbi:hypothetical protein MOX02_29770 [Methylobacterium oxalidis]|uniref:Uncharacterized protein n=1 Tax=Methylobacterium oxalidis TaxID=944322 RepID=A0A512J500_9HYPH|nr:hypothetical protein MOX02_29770 [Methylobacterium oxalidis]GLS63676.1 hypothetical protein GCM10007888_20570 [Methylobacterium oxalidis]
MARPIASASNEVPEDDPNFFRFGGRPILETRVRPRRIERQENSEQRQEPAERASSEHGALLPVVRVGASHSRAAEHVSAMSCPLRTRPTVMGLMDMRIADAAMRRTAEPA